MSRGGPARRVPARVPGSARSSAAVSLAAFSFSGLAFFGLTFSSLPIRGAPFPVPWVTPPLSTAAPTSPSPVSCEGPGDPDLYCIELLPAAAGGNATGSAEMLPPSSPFGVSVTPEGVHRWELAISLEGLPDPARLGSYTTYVAWAAPPQLHPLLKLGEVGNGRTLVGPFALDRFLVFVSAEPSGEGEERTGPLVLRGSSPSMRIQPHDMPELMASFLLEGGGEAVHEHAPHDPTGLPGDSLTWTPPPMHPLVSMPGALMRLRPDVSPYLPEPREGVPEARPRELIRMADGDTLSLTAGSVRRILRGREVVMLAFNEQYPGPLLQVDQESTVVIRFRNETDFPTAVHWHGLRLENRFDGVPHVTQEPVPPGGEFVYEVRFPDAGIYWYHPHHREDVLQGLGLYGNIHVRSPDPDYLGPVHREEFLILDDLLVGDTGLVPFGLEAPTHALMGRFGNLLLINGEPLWQMGARTGEVVRLHFTNVSNTRTFNLSLRGGDDPGGVGARMKLVASDLGRYTREVWVENVVLAPAERYVLDVRFPVTGSYLLVNDVAAIDHLSGRFFQTTDTVGRVHVEGPPVRPDLSPEHETLRWNQDVADEIERLRPHFDRPVDLELLLTLRTGELPFPLESLLGMESVHREPVEWSGVMPEMDWVATGREVRWILRDPGTGRENLEIDWRLRVGEVRKLRLVSDRHSLHAMQHPIHIHGQRFLVLSVNGVPNRHPVWKDTVLVPAGFVVDLLLEVTNPGQWMLHCHIAEHIEAGMKLVFQVD